MLNQVSLDTTTRGFLSKLVERLQQDPELVALQKDALRKQIEVNDFNLRMMKAQMEMMKNATPGQVPTVD